MHSRFCYKKKKANERLIFSTQSKYFLFNQTRQVDCTYYIIKEKSIYKKNPGLDVPQ
jgi:hypothetical protein